MHWQELRGQSRGASLQSAGIFSASRACAEDIYQHCLRCDQVTRPWSCPVQARRESAGEGLSGETSGNDEDDQWEPCSPEATRFLAGQAEIVRAWCRERVCQYVWIWVAAVL